MKTHNLLFLTAALMLSSCASKQNVEASHNIETVTVQHTTDTVYVALPHENLQATVPPDSVSTLQTATAESTARLTPDGHIEHRLYTRDTVITVPVPTIITTRSEHNDTKCRQTSGGTASLPWILTSLMAIMLALFLLRKVS